MDRMNAVYNNARFYIDHYRRMLRVALVLLALNFLVLAILYIQHFMQPKPQFFVTTADGRMIEVNPLQDK